MASKQQRASMGVFFYDLLFFASACGDSRMSIDALVTHLFAYIYILRSGFGLSIHEVYGLHSWIMGTLVE